MEASNRPLDGQEPGTAPQEKVQSKDSLLSGFTAMRAKLFATILAAGMVGESANAAESVIDKPVQKPVARKILLIDDVRAIRAKDPASRFHSRRNPETNVFEYVQMTPEEVEADDRKKAEAMKKRKEKDDQIIAAAHPLSSVAASARGRGRTQEQAPVIQEHPPELFEPTIEDDSEPPIVEKQPMETAAPAEKPVVPVAIEVQAHAADRIEAPDTVQEAQKAMVEKNFLVIDHGYNAKNNFEKNIREKSIAAPTGFKPAMLTVTATVRSDGSTQVLLPCPRDIGDQTNGGSKVKVLNAQGKEVPATSRIVYSEEEVGGYKNPFILIDLQGAPTIGYMTIVAKTLVLKPVYPKVTDQQMAAAAGPEASAVIMAAAQKAAAVQWDGNINGIDINLFRQHGKGDCGVKAAVAREAGAGMVEAVEGYSFRKKEDAKFGGKHCINIARTPGGMFMFDPRTEQDLYRGPQDSYIVTSVGGNNLIKEWNADAILHGTNGGFYRGANKLTPAEVAQGVKNYELAAANLQELDMNVLSREMQNYANALWGWNMQKYAPKVAAANQQANAD